MTLPVVSPNGRGARHAPRVLLALALTAAALLPGDRSSSAGPAADWPGYLHGPRHSSFNPEATSITSATAGSVTQTAWRWVPPSFADRSPPATLEASPTVYRGKVFIGSSAGRFYALRETDGEVIWKRDLGYVTPCEPQSTTRRGITATATAAVDPATGQPTVYVTGGVWGGGLGGIDLYAFDVDTGDLSWHRRVSDQAGAYAWSSPTVRSGRIYVGVASGCDHPLVRGRLVEVDQRTGRILDSVGIVPRGSVGGSIWSSAAVSRDHVWVTTGNPEEKEKGEGDAGLSNSIVGLGSDTLAVQDSWTVPPEQSVHDGDFGGSPVLFSALVHGRPTGLVGACNKNGFFYAWDRDRLSTGPLWRFRVGVEAQAAPMQMCLSAAIWNGEQLFVAGDQTTVAGAQYRGSIRSLDPATGDPIWETGLPASVLGSPSLDGAGVIAVPTHDLSGAPNAVYLVDAGTGTVLGSVDTIDSEVFAQPVFAGNWLFVATRRQGLLAYPAPA